MNSVPGVMTFESSLPDCSSCVSETFTPSSSLSAAWNNNQKLNNSQKDITLVRTLPNQHQPINERHIYLLQTGKGKGEIFAQGKERDFSLFHQFKCLLPKPGMLIKRKSNPWSPSNFVFPWIGINKWFFFFFCFFTFLYKKIYLPHYHLPNVPLLSNTIKLTSSAASLAALNRRDRCWFILARGATPSTQSNPAKSKQLPIKKNM